MTPCGAVAHRRTPLRGAAPAGRCAAVFHCPERRRRESSAGGGRRVPGQARSRPCRREHEEGCATPRWGASVHQVAVPLGSPRHPRDAQPRGGERRCIPHRGVARTHAPGAAPPLGRQRTMSAHGRHRAACHVPPDGGSPRVARSCARAGRGAVRTATSVRRTCDADARRYPGGKRLPPRGAWRCSPSIGGSPLSPEEARCGVATGWVAFRPALARGPGGHTGDGWRSAARAGSLAPAPDAAGGAPPPWSAGAGAAAAT